jgi:hypothetical protein
MLAGESFKAIPQMASPSHPRKSAGFDQPTQKPPTPVQSAGYTYDMLVSLGKIAVFHRQSKLALLIEAAALEARALQLAEPDEA